MNGYTMLADSYRKMLEDEQEQANKEMIAKRIKVLDFLATCDDTEKCFLFDSTAFNDIYMGYVRKAVNSLDCLDDEQRQAVRNRAYVLLSECTAKDMLDYYNK